MSLKNKILTDEFKLRYIAKGFSSRKFIAAALTAVVMFIAWIASNWLTQAAGNLPALITGLAAVLASYTAGNVVDGTNDAKNVQNQNTDNTVVVNVPDPKA